jgi:hypothetical protein
MFVANGYKRDVFDGDAQQKLGDHIRKNMHKYQSPEEMLEKGFKEFINVYEPIKVKNYLFRNKGDLQFDNVTDAWGFNVASFSNGAAVGDLDNDGDLDLVINNLDEEAFIYESTASRDHNYLKVKLAGPKANAYGIGAKVTVYSNGKMQYFENKTVRGYLSSNDPIVHFGLGKDEKIDSLFVRWNDGKENALKGFPVNQLVSVNYSEAHPASVRNMRISPLFEESTSQVLTGLFNHRENEVNEYKEQVLLPHMFSRNGPFISTGDVDGDGSEDFFVGGAAGQTGSLYVQKNGRLIKKQNVAFESDKAYEDMGSVLFDVDQDKDLDLYVVSGGSEFPEGNKLYADRLYVNDGGNFRKSDLIQTISSGSCVVPIDIDGDGDLDLFRGGQVVAGMYPKSPKSYLLINENGKLIDRTKEVAPVLSEVGMVSSAAGADLNGDKTPELVIVGEWMPVKVFQSKNGKLEDISSELGLDGTEGWWSKIIADDLDGDGDYDLIAGNIGENYKFKASKEKPFQVFAKDFDRNGTNDIFLARYYKDTLLVPIRGRECTSQQMPVIAEKFPTYLSFAQSDLPAILGRDIENALHKKAHLFSSVILINENGKFSKRKLPTDAQLSAITGIIVNDFDKDGKKDILLAGNKFDSEVETTPADASPGLFLKGLGGLNFKPMKPLESGFFVPYNVKDIQSVTLNKELAIIIGINNEGLKIFKSKVVAANKGPIAAIK